MFTTPTRPIALTLAIALCAGLFGEFAFTRDADADTTITASDFKTVEMVIDGEIYEVKVRQDAPKLIVDAGVFFY
ncbi:hypothetical protein [uncultured Limimaricola sp.]|uniref:hypothetical protein n=1 Tax=uncultured Limimaricola sp. TaxID=2211667 RepID=UPI0030F6915E